jgi:hypothetical protein
VFGCGERLRREKYVREREYKKREINELIFFKGTK